MLAAMGFTATELDLVNRAKATATIGLETARKMPADLSITRKRLEDTAAYLMKNADDILRGKDRDFYKLERDIPVVQELTVEAQKVMARGGEPAQIPIPAETQIDIQNTPQAELDMFKRNAAVDTNGKMPAGMGMMLMLGGGLLLMTAMGGGGKRTVRRGRKGRRRR